jgi:MYXO-CTERM domain-containing protein
VIALAGLAVLSSTPSLAQDTAAAPAAETTSQRSGIDTIDMDRALPIAGSAGLGLVLLGGIWAMRRRKRCRPERPEAAAEPAYMEASTEPLQPTEKALGKTAGQIPAKGNWESRADADFLFYRAGNRSALKPPLQK